MTRRLVVPAFAFAAALLAGRGAVAQFDAGTTTTATTFAPADFFIGVQSTVGNNLSDFNVARFFNKATCDCSAPVYIYVTLVDSGFAKRPSISTTATSGRIEFWIGQQCDNVTYRASYCTNIKTETLSEFLQLGHDTIPTNARVLSTYSAGGTTTDADGGVVTVNPSGVFPPTGNPDCTVPTGQQFTQSVYALISNSGNLTYDTVVQRNVLIDLVPPPAPDSNSMTVEGGNEALVVGWQKLDTAVTTDLQGYQILCNRGGSLQVFNHGAFTPGFVSCPATVAANGGGITGLDPFFACSPVLTASATSYRVKILQNQIVYGVAVVALDLSGNASAPDTFYGTPVKTESFYDVYRNGNEGSTRNMDVPGGATGGLCALAPARPGRTPTLAGLGVGLAAVAFAVARRWRRR